jgi:hypothetical protein
MTEFSGELESMGVEMDWVRWLIDAVPHSISNWVGNFNLYKLYDWVEN